MTRSIKDFNDKMIADGYTLTAIFTLRNHWDGLSYLEVRHCWVGTKYPNCAPWQAVMSLKAPKKVEKWLDSYWKQYRTADMTGEDIENFFKTWEKKMRACGLDPETIAQIDGDDN